MRTLNDITPPSRRKEVEPLSKSAMHTSERPPKFPYATVSIIVLVIIASIGALFYFSSARVEIMPSTVSAAVQSSFTANQSGGALPYEVITAQKIATQSVKGSGTKTVSSSASGNMTIYNTQTKSQKLITNTRFATAAGLIFRIHAAVTIPGGSASKPGTLTVKVFADQPGDSYNIAPTSFTVPGFAGTALASAVYARSTSAMTGGASGTVPVVDSAVLSQAQGALISALSPELLASIQTQVPSGYILLPGAATTTFQALSPVSSGTTGMVDVKEQGTVTAVVFPNAALAGALAASVPGLGYQNEPLTLASSSNLTLSGFTMPDPSATSFTFTMTGTASLIYTVDPTRISAAIAGKTRSAAEVALTNYPEVKRAVIVLRPFWRQAFPQDPSSIAVTVLNP